MKARCPLVNFMMYLHPSPFMAHVLVDGNKSLLSFLCSMNHVGTIYSKVKYMIDGFGNLSHTLCDASLT